MSEDRIFKGKRIFLTRENNSVLSERLSGLGADVVEMPLIHVAFESDAADLADILEETGHYDWITFSSVNGVRGFFKEFFKVFEDVRCIGFASIACVGETTAREVRKYYLNPAVVPQEFNAEAMVKAMSEYETLDNLRILCVRGNLSSGDALQKLEREHGAIVDELKVYNVSLNEIPASLPAAKTFRDKGADAIVFCSPSAVEAFAKSAKNLQLSPSAKVPKIVAIGSTTSEALAKFGMRASAVAECADIESALRKALGE